MMDEESELEFDPTKHEPIVGGDQVSIGEQIYNRFVGSCVVLSKSDKWIHVEYEGIPGGPSSRAAVQLYSRADPIGFYGEDDLLFEVMADYKEGLLPYFWRRR